MTPETTDLTAQVSDDIKTLQAPGLLIRTRSDAPTYVYVPITLKEVGTWLSRIRTVHYIKTKPAMGTLQDIESFNYKTPDVVWLDMNDIYGTPLEAITDSEGMLDNLHCLVTEPIEIQNPPDYIELSRMEVNEDSVRWLALYDGGDEPEWHETPGIYERFIKELIETLKPKTETKA